MKGSDRPLLRAEAVAAEWDAKGADAHPRKLRGYNLIGKLDRIANRPIDVGSKILEPDGVSLVCQPETGVRAAEVTAMYQHGFVVRDQGSPP
jgi:hypothetical protein